MINEEISEIDLVVNSKQSLDSVILTIETTQGVGGRGRGATRSRGTSSDTGPLLELRNFNPSTHKIQPGCAEKYLMPGIILLKW